MPAEAFRYWVVLAGMRTGSNLLEEHLAAFPGIRSHGELFNPHFFGRPKANSQFGLSLGARDSDPLKVIEAMCAQSECLPGFRLFYDHDPRVIDHVLHDRTAAKIVLTRRPIDSFVSLKVARQTGQWWLGDVTAARTAKVRFDKQEYAEFLTVLADFQSKIARRLQSTGQTAFHIGYDDLSSSDVIAGLGQFVGAKGPQVSARVRAKVQNPGPLAERLINPDEARSAAQEFAYADIDHTPMREPDRGPGLKFFRATAIASLLYMPIRGAAQDPVPEWLKSVDPSGEVLSGLTQQELRRWKRQHVGHRSFTVLRHPLPRAYDAFCRCILPTDHDSYADIREALRTRYDVPLPETGPGADWTLRKQRDAFSGFLTFLKANLGGQTSLRVDNTWASQTTLLQAIGDFSVPDRVIREDRLPTDLADLASETGLDAVPAIGTYSVETPFALREVQTDDINAKVRAAYQRDFMMFGFAPWAPDQAA